MSFVDILWTIVSVFLLLCLFVAVGGFAVAVTYIQATGGTVPCNESTKR